MGSAPPARAHRARFLVPVLLSAVLLTGCTAAPAPSPSPSGSRLAGGWTAELAATSSGAGTAEIAVQVLGSPARTVRASSVTVPWIERVATAAAVKGGTASWTVSVAPSTGGATVGCSIRIDGVVVAEERSATPGRGVVCHAVRPA